MSTFATVTVILAAIGVIAWVSAALERHQQTHAGVSWVETLARRSPGTLLPEGDRDLARTLDDVRAASQRDAS